MLVTLWFRTCIHLQQRIVCFCGVVWFRLAYHQVTRAVHGRNTDKFTPCVLQVGWYSGCGCLCGLKVAAVQCLYSTSSFLFVAIGFRNGEAMKAFMGDSMTMAAGVGAIAQKVGLIAV